MSNPSREDERVQPSKSFNNIRTSKKKIKTGRMTDVMKNLRLQSHEPGEPCHCLRLKCHENVTEEQRKSVLKYFNSLSSNNEQNNYLAGLITTICVQRHRPRENCGTLHDVSFAYRIRVITENGVEEDIPVCAKAFMSIHGIGRGKLQYIQNSLKYNAEAPKGKRGLHSSKHRKLDQRLFQSVYEHIKSFRGRLSHYSFKKIKKKLYLPEELNCKKGIKCILRSIRI